MMKSAGHAKNGSSIMREIRRARFSLFSAILFALVPVIFGVRIPDFLGTVLASDDDFLNLNSEQLASNFDGYFQQAETAIANIDLRQARQELSLIQFKIERHKKQLSRDVRKTYDARLAALNASVKQKVDSLVKVNLTVLKKNGQTAGIEFRQQLAIQRGLSEAELAPVDEAIINTAPGTDHETDIRKPAVPEPPVTGINLPPPHPVPEPVREEKPVMQPAPVQSAPIPAPGIVSILPSPSPENLENKKPLRDTSAASLPIEPQSSQRSDRDRTAALSTGARVYALLDAGKFEEAMTVFKIYQGNMQHFLNPPDFDKLKSAIEDANTQDQNQHAHASQQVQTIDNLIDQERAPEAFAKFKTVREELSRCLDREEFRKLEERVGKANINFGRAQGAANMKAREIQTLLESKKVEEASLAFEKSRSELERGLPKDGFERLRQEIETVYNALKDKRKLSILSGKEIFALIKEGKGTEASARFNEDRPMLQQYMDAGSFTSLQAAVKRANYDFLTRQAKARHVVGTVDSLLTCNKVEEARHLFDESKGRIRHDLADDKGFFELKERLTKAFGDLRDKRRQVERSAQNIKYLINRKEGLNAFACFQQDSTLLKEYLEPRVFVKLGKAVQQAKAEYESNMAQAQSMEHKIEGLLVKKRIEEAYTVFDSVESALKNYLDDKTFIDLKTQVEKSNSMFQYKKSEAFRTVGTINRLIVQNEGDSAYKVFYQSEAFLAEYLNASNFSATRTRVSRARIDYIKKCKNAETLARRLQSLVKSNQVQMAYIGFDDKHDFLEHYLDKGVYARLETAVRVPYEAFMQKLKGARTTVSSINNMIRQNQVAAARVEFYRHRNEMEHYLPADEFVMIQEKVDKAYRGRNLRKDP
jgi:hypothetical protein